MDRGQDVVLKILYLFMHSDGKLTSRELDKFEKICEELEISEKDRKELMEEMSVNYVISNHTQVITILSKILDQQPEPSDSFFDLLLNQNLLAKKEFRTKLVWLLINLGYSDDQFSMEERAVVEFISKRWSIPNVFLYEMYDTAETVISLQHQNEWLDTLGGVHLETINANRETIRRMYENIEMLIEESKLPIEDHQISVEKIALTNN